MMNMTNANIIARVDGINGKLYEAGAEFRAVYDRVWKAGGERDALILKADDNSVSPVAYPDSSWWQMTDTEISEILQDMYANANYRDPSIVRKHMTEQHIRASVLPRLLSGKNTAALKQNGITHVPFLDMAVVFYVPVSSYVIDGIASYRITDCLLVEMGITKETLCTWAANNLQAQDPVFLPMASVLEEMCGREADCETGLWVLTNEERLFGAAMLQRDDVLKEIGQRFKGDAVILPSSVHEILALPYEETIDLLSLTEMVQAINAKCVKPEDVLSDNVYIYHRKDGHLTAVL